MSDKKVSDIELNNNKGTISLAGGDITTIGDTTIGEIYQKIVLPDIPPDKTDDKLIASLENNRELLINSKRELALLVLSESKNYKLMEVSIKNIKLAGDNINSLINALSVRGHICQHLPQDSHYEQDTLDILRLRNKIINEHTTSECPHCNKELMIKNKNNKKDMIVSIDKPEKSFLLFNQCKNHSRKNGFTISFSATVYCKSCKNPVCIYFARMDNSIENYINIYFPKK